MNDSRKCSAKKIGGKPCNRWAILGGNVCVWHGGSAPAAQKQAKLRLLAMVEPAILALEEVLEEARKDRDWNAVTKAAVALLDRAGHGMKSTVVLEDGSKDLTLLSTEDLRLRALTIAEDLKRRQREEEPALIAGIMGGNPSGAAH